MSYEVLARKWRPQGFDEVVGQDHVTTPLRNAIRSDRVPHAILLTGPRGTGKTTVARILARCLNCEKGPTDTPCGECTPCREIAVGTSTEVQEVDAASRTGVDDVRELIEAIRYAPPPGKHKIFVVDEVHMLSKAAFNALLKTLEEPPPHSLFLFATTNPESIPFTVVSRCQRYDLRRIPAAEIALRLRLITQAEKIRISDGSLLAIARESDGSMRDSQTLLDQVVAYGGSEVSDDAVADVLDLIDRRLLLAILSACVDGDAPRALEACVQADRSGIDAKRLGENLLQLLRDLVVLGIAPNAERLIESSAEEVSELRELSKRCDPARLRRMFRSLLREQEDLAWAPQPFAVLEMAVVRLATMPAGGDVQQLLARLDALEQRLRDERGPAGGSAAGGAAEGRRRRGRPSAGTPSERASGASSEAEDVSANAPPDAIFDRLRGVARKRNPGLFAALEGGQLALHGPDHLHIAVATPFSAKRLNQKRADLEAVCTDFFGRRMRVDIGSIGGSEGSEADGEPADAAAVNTKALREQRQQALDHPAVNQALEVLGGQILEIRPAGGES